MEQLQPKNNLTGWWKKVVFENYANFSGRARRSEYWYFVLGNIVFIAPLYLLAVVAAVSDYPFVAGMLMLVTGLVALGIFLPGLAVAVRRLHDINKSGWYYLVSFIPFIGSIILLVWFCTEGTRGSNQYGPDPKQGPQFEFEATGAVQS